MSNLSNQIVKIGHKLHEINMTLPAKGDEALQGTVRILDALLSEGFTGYDEDSRKVKAALAKARGEQKQEKSQ